MTKTTEHLHQQIEQLVREHLAAQKAAATAAVERAFSSVLAAKRASAVSRQPTWGRRRPPVEVAGLAERLFQAVRANPGETMTVIAAHVGESPRALHRPMHHLRRAGRVRSAGQRHLTRYFPMTSSKS